MQNLSIDSELSLKVYIRILLATALLHFC